MIYVAIAEAFFSLSRKLFHFFLCEKRNINVALNIRFFLAIPDPHFSPHTLLLPALPTHLFMFVRVLQNAKINFK